MLSYDCFQSAYTIGKYPILNAAKVNERFDGECTSCCLELCNCLPFTVLALTLDF